MKTIILFTILILILSVAMAQNPFCSIGVKDKDVKVLTLSNGKYEEFEQYNRYQRVGSVVMDMQTMKIAYFIDRDTLRSEATLEPEVVSRWLSQDPLAAKFPNMSPYNFVANNPIMLIDPGGEFPISIHEKMLSSIMGGKTNLCKMKTSDIIIGIGWLADSPTKDGLAKNTFVHFDSFQGQNAYTNISNNWNRINKGLSEASQNGNGLAFGVYLHATGDFYSHSNYIELYIEYYKSFNNNNTTKFDIEKTPTFDEMNNNEEFKEFKKICQEKLITGNADETGEYTHDNTGKDTPNTLEGSKIIETSEGELNYSYISETVAKKDVKSKVEKTVKN